MFTENDVIDAVCRALSEEGWTITGKASTGERGVDVTATQGDRILLIEAKGEGSSKEGTSRFGSPFNRGQVRTHIGVAILKALQVVSDRHCQAAIAVPDNENHRLLLGEVADVLLGLGIALMWASPQGVEIQWPAGNG